MIFRPAPSDLYTRRFELNREPEGDTGGPSCDEGMQSQAPVIIEGRHT